MHGITKGRAKTSSVTHGKSFHIFLVRTFVVNLFRAVIKCIGITLCVRVFFMRRFFFVNKREPANGCRKQFYGSVMRFHCHRFIWLSPEEIKCSRLECGFLFLCWFQYGCVSTSKIIKSIPSRIKPRMIKFGKFLRKLQQAVVIFVYFLINEFEY